MQAYIAHKSGQKDLLLPFVKSVDLDSNLDLHLHTKSESSAVLAETVMLTGLVEHSISKSDAKYMRGLR